MPKDLNGAQTGMSSSNSVNNPRPSNIRGRNVFPQSYLHLTTDCYGNYNPFFWAKCERGDIQNLMPKHDLHTFTMKSPMVNEVTMTKSYVKVPMQAIYPRNWDKMFTIPTQGDDVPSDCRALLDVSNLVSALVELINNGSNPIIRIRAFVLLEAICSNGGLLPRFNQHLGYKFYTDSFPLSSIDTLADEVFYPKLIEFAKNHSFKVNDVSIFVSSEVNGWSEGRYYVSPRRFIELLRSGDILFSPGWSSFTFGVTDLEIRDGYISYNSDDTNSNFINIEPLISYQLACAQFATNDFVDFIYNAKLYRDNLQSIVLPALRDNLPTFLYNGVVTLYDVFSEKYFNSLIGVIIDNDSTSESAIDYFMNIFSYVPSLRYGDYFTGAKPQPLAVGEYSAQVSNNSVSAIDITRSIQMQRLLHRVNMIGRKIGDYLTGIFGGQLPEAEKDVPIFLALQRFNLKGFETENTAEIQFNDEYSNTITSHLRSAESKHAFEIEIDEPCYIIGMNSYETIRIYSRTMDRFSFHHDRYDDFIPEMQYIGDQDIRLTELDSNQLVRPFGYCLRYMEYKQRYSYASGGFIENLPSWAFITDNNDGNPAPEHIDPSYIRSSPSEFDRFFKSLNGYSLGSYFHFIVAHYNHTEPSRMMEYTPEILK